METSGGTAAQRPTHSIALILALTALLSVAAVAVSRGLPTPPINTLHTPHASIRIQSNSEVTAAHGVVGGHRTPHDPYRIARWGMTDVDTTGAHFLPDTEAGF